MFGMDDTIHEPSKTLHPSILALSQAEDPKKRMSASRCATRWIDKKLSSPSVLWITKFTRNSGRVGKILRGRNSFRTHSVQFVLNFISQTPWGRINLSCVCHVVFCVSQFETNFERDEVRRRCGKGRDDSWRENLKSFSIKSEMYLTPFASLIRRNQIKQDREWEKRCLHDTANKQLNDSFEIILCSTFFPTDSTRSKACNETPTWHDDVKLQQKAIFLPRNFQLRLMIILKALLRKRTLKSFDYSNSPCEAPGKIYYKHKHT